MVSGICSAENVHPLENSKEKITLYCGNLEIPCYKPHFTSSKRNLPCARLYKGKSIKI